MMVSLPTHICVTRPQLVNINRADIHMKETQTPESLGCISKLQNNMQLTTMYDIHN